MAENPYIRIIKAAKEGVGVRLTAEECYYLAQDDSIVQVAARTADGEVSNGGGFVVTRAGFVDAPSPQPNVQPLLKRMSDLLDDLSPEDTIGFTNGSFWIDAATVEEIRKAAYPSPQPKTEAS